MVKPLPKTKNTRRLGEIIARHGAPSTPPLFLMSLPAPASGSSAYRVVTQSAFLSPEWTIAPFCDYREKPLLEFVAAARVARSNALFGAPTPPLPTQPPALVTRCRRNLTPRALYGAYLNATVDTSEYLLNGADLLDPAFLTQNGKVSLRVHRSLTQLSFCPNTGVVTEQPVATPHTMEFCIADASGKFATVLVRVPSRGVSVGIQGLAVFERSRWFLRVLAGKCVAIHPLTGTPIPVKTVANQTALDDGHESVMALIPGHVLRHRQVFQQAFGAVTPIEAFDAAGVARGSWCGTMAGRLIGRGEVSAPLTAVGTPFEGDLPFLESLVLLTGPLGTVSITIPRREQMHSPFPQLQPWFLLVLFALEPYRRAIRHTINSLVAESSARGSIPVVCLVADEANVRLALALLGHPLHPVVVLSPEREGTDLNPSLLGGTPEIHKLAASYKRTLFLTAEGLSGDLSRAMLLEATPKASKIKVEGETNPSLMARQQPHVQRMRTLLRFVELFRARLAGNFRQTGELHPSLWDTLTYQELETLRLQYHEHKAGGELGEMWRVFRAALTVFESHYLPIAMLELKRRDATQVPRLLRLFLQLLVRLTPFVRDFYPYLARRLDETLTVYRPDFVAVFTHPELSLTLQGLALVFRTIRELAEEAKNLPRASIFMESPLSLSSYELTIMGQGRIVVETDITRWAGGQIVAERFVGKGFGTLYLVTSGAASTGVEGSLFLG